MEDNSTENMKEYNQSQYHSKFSIETYFGFFLVSSTICILGLVGNGFVIYFLGYQMKRNPFTTYIWNLSIADSGVLTVQFIYNIYCFFEFFYDIPYSIDIYFLLDFILLFLTITSQLLLFGISIDRCACLYFPLWHRCHQPPLLSTAVCAIIWILAFLISATNIALSYSRRYYDLWLYPFFLNAVLLMPIMCGSTIAMSIKGCSRLAKWRPGKLLRAIWLTLVSFLLFAFPMNAIYGFSVFLKWDSYLFRSAFVCISLNSAINPFIYYLVGRDKRGRSSKRIKKVLEKLFKEGEDCAEERETSASTQI